MLGRLWRWAREQIAFLVVLAGVASSFGFLVAQSRHPVRGTGAIAVVMIAAGLLRLCLPSAAVGLLAVRNRWIDTACYFVLGGLIIATDLRLRQ